MENKFELQFEDNEYYLVDGNTNDTIGTTDKVLLKEYDGYMKKLSIKNCQAIANGYDLDELAVLSTKEETTIVGNQKMAQGFIKGFQKALEILGDKKFSEFDIAKTFEYGWNQRHFGKTDEDELRVIQKIFIQSLYQTDWDVEIEMEPYYDGDFVNDGKTHVFEAKLRPQLDSEGCIILKRKI